MKYLLLISSTLLLPLSCAFAEKLVVDELINAYQLQGATSPSVQQGQNLWKQTFVAI